MDDDEEMIVIIVGDQSDDNHQTLALPTIKEEPVDELEQPGLNPDSILETAELHGEYISLKEENYDYEYLEEEEEEDILLKHEITPSVNDAEDSRLKRLPQRKHKSYIDQLRKNFPKLRKDDNYVIAHLADVMRNTKAPPPPSGFCDKIDRIFV